MRAQRVCNFLRAFAKLVPTIEQTIGTDSALLSAFDGLVDVFESGLLKNVRLNMQFVGRALPKPYVPSPYKQ